MLRKSGNFVNGRIRVGKAFSFPKIKIKSVFRHHPAKALFGKRSKILAVAIPFAVFAANNDNPPPINNEKQGSVFCVS